MTTQLGLRQWDDHGDADYLGSDKGATSNSIISSRSRSESQAGAAASEDIRGNSVEGADCRDANYLGATLSSDKGGTSDGVINSRSSFENQATAAASGGVRRNSVEGVSFPVFERESDTAQPTSSTSRSGPTSRIWIPASVKKQPQVPFRSDFSSVDSVDGYDELYGGDYGSEASDASLKPSAATRENKTGLRGISGRPLLFGDSPSTQRRWPLLFEGSPGSQRRVSASGAETKGSGGESQTGRRAEEVGKRDGRHAASRDDLWDSSVDLPSKKAAAKGGLRAGVTKGSFPAHWEAEVDDIFSWESLPLGGSNASDMRRGRKARGSIRENKKQEEIKIERVEDLRITEPPISDTHKALLSTWNEESTTSFDDGRKQEIEEPSGLDALRPSSTSTPTAAVTDAGRAAAASPPTSDVLSHAAMATTAIPDGKRATSASPSKSDKLPQTSAPTAAVNDGSRATAASSPPNETRPQAPTKSGSPNSLAAKAVKNSRAVVDLDDLQDDDWLELTSLGKSIGGKKAGKWGAYMDAPEQKKQKSKTKKASVSPAPPPARPSNKSESHENEQGNRIPERVAPSKKEMDTIVGLTRAELDTLASLAGEQLSPSERCGMFEGEQPLKVVPNHPITRGRAAVGWEQWWCLPQISVPLGPREFSVFETLQQEHSTPLYPVSLCLEKWTDSIRSGRQAKALNERRDPVTVTGYQGDSFMTQIHGGLEVLMVQKASSIEAAVAWLRDSLTPCALLGSLDPKQSDSSASSTSDASSAAGQQDTRDIDSHVPPSTSTDSGDSEGLFPEGQSWGLQGDKGNKDCVISMHLESSSIGASKESMSVLVLCTKTRCLVLHLSNMNASHRERRLPSKFEIREEHCLGLRNLLTCGSFMVVTAGWGPKPKELLSQTLWLGCRNIPW
eukprot:gene16378-22580_t